MTQALSGAAIAAVIAACWLLGRPRPKILRSTDASAVAALNRSQMELVLPRQREAASSADSSSHNSLSVALPSAADRRGRLQLLAQLERQFQQGGEPRRQALAVCSAWQHRDALPLIRRGLRDSDQQVAALAAEAMAHFRGRSAATAQLAVAKPPRNVSRTR
ncbi:HEAT repeat domain-containing protein [Vulcanococcus sp. Clear-D1]|jgi:hypothetical protein|uniref:HEAT repeat domain-containing protein n=1 Tax=Vulcanococcus sp. Clear-D1 TaxID=2766970 RepID=UPI0019856F26|nr:HEAT repeat domain-containing protein [Vulcanococcus sp. Clear-D1]MBD1192992.1 HEAT repeat domain-containing protein [Vulcanococcus sp. Clear-D1]